MQDIKIGNTVPRGVCVLNQHYCVQKNHQLLRTLEALKIIEAVYSNGVFFVILILIIIILTNLEVCCVWSLEGFPSAGYSHHSFDLWVRSSGCCLVCALGSLYSRAPPGVLIAHFSVVASKCVC